MTRSLDIAAAYLLQVLLFGDVPLWTSLAGAIIVILAVFSMAAEEMVLSLVENCFGDTVARWL